MADHRGAHPDGEAPSAGPDERYARGRDEAEHGMRASGVRRIRVVRVSRRGGLPAARARIARMMIRTPTY